MTCSHNVVFLLDTASSVQKAHLHLGTLKILNYLGSRFGLDKVQWGFKFFDSLGVQGRISRVGSFHELGSRSWEDFEEELEARFENCYHALNLPGSSSRATLAQNMLKEALLDYQWDRPEIASPAKVVLRSQKSKLTVTSEKPQRSSNPSEDFMNTVFLFSPCPHSQRELQHFVSGSHAHLSHELPTLQDLSEKFIPKGIQEMMAAQKITLHWVDTADDSTPLDSPDHVGYHTLAELLRILKGTILPSEIFIRHLNCHRTQTFPLESISPKLFSSWATILPLDSTLNCLFSSPSALQASFPHLEGMLFLKSDGIQKPQSCAVTLEPLTVSQRCFENPVSIFLKCTVAGWNMMHTSSFPAESWIIQSSPLGQSVQEMSLFQHLVRCILAQGLHLVADVSPSGSCSPCTGIFSPISSTAAVLSLLCAERMAEVERCLLQTAEEGNLSTEDDFSSPEMVSSMLNQVNDLKENGPVSPAETTLPEWVQQELFWTHRWSPVVIESWYLLSNLCGGSSPLMESLRLLQGAPATVEETRKPEMELTHSLSEFYHQRASKASATSRRRDHKKRHGAPQTPVRQKMKTMPRSLKMLNVARLNMRAQKLQPDEELAVSEKVAQRLLPRRADDGVEEKERTVRAKLDFKTEEEMVSYATASYQKAVADGENLSSCARDIVAAMSIFQITNEVQETVVACTAAIRSSLLKTSKALRQELGNIPDKQVKVRECQLQVYLRLEMSLQYPLIQKCTGEMEQLVEEMTEVLRILCLNEDPAYLTKFLEDIVEMYMESIPKTLGSLYYSLGTQVPPKLASILPADFFGDDSVSQESQVSSHPASAASDPAARSASVNDEADRLQELRTRSAKKRKSLLSRHRSVTEASLNLRQIEIPQAPKARTRKDSSRASLDMKLFPAAQKTPVQEVTKVRRNLFNEEIHSPSKRILRSQSVSALEGLKHKHGQSNEALKDHHKLLTKRVAETPLHKQISRRLLYRQIQGRCSDPGSEVGVVEESPEKALTCGLRRSPRIKQLLLDRTFSGSFQSSKAIIKNVEEVPSAHLEGPGNPEDLTGWALPSPKNTIQSPKSLLFGALHEAPSSGGMQSQRKRRKSLASDDPVAYQTPRKTPRRSSQRFLSPPSNILRRSPRIQEKSQLTFLKSPVPKQTVAKNLGCLFSPPKQKSKPSPTSIEKKGESPAQSTLSKENFSPPCRAWQLHTPRKQETGEVFGEVFGSPTNSSHSDSCFVATTLLPLNPRGKSHSQPHFPKQSLRTAWKPAFLASAQRQTPEAERPRDLNYFEQLKSDPTPRKFGGGPTDQSLSPKSAGVAEALSPQVSLSNFTSLPCTQLRAGYMLSPCTTPEQVREICTPKKSPLKLQSRSGITPAESVQSPSCVSEGSLHTHKSKGEPSQWDVLISPTETDSFCKPGINESVSLVPGYEQASGTVAPSKVSERHLSPELLARDSRCILDAIAASECVDPSASTNKGNQKLLSNSSPGQQGPMALQDKVLPAAKFLDLRQPFFQTPPRCTMKSSAPKFGSSTYTLRCTPGRRQREAAARLGNIETMSNVIIPRNTHALPSTTSPPTYEVQLEMQASGLPKLRIKRVGSGVPIELQSQAETRKSEVEESKLDTGDLCVSWCGRHSGKLEPVCISPSCLRSTHSTPGKLGGGQTYICQSYTPSRCISSCTSPSDGSANISWTPSPKQKAKVTPEAIKDWPRRKRAIVGCNKSERQAEPSTDEWGLSTELFGGSKALGVGEFELEGVYRLQDQSPCSDTETCRDKCVHKGPFGLKSRKRVFEHLSPEEEASWETKRACPVQEPPAVAVHSTKLFSIRQERASSIRTNLEKETFNFSGLTPPSSVKSNISASSIRALTQSPLLYQGCATSQKKCLPEDDSDLGARSEDLSPFNSAPSKRRPLSRIYSRKRLLS
ncbi:PREDICTED: treslin [Gekko japonicus]|uniref:Treslin n=1 Tax=Gekko japonicus TaxID=146911 RepID=A0ABM1KLZ4_GEKJA|nr:PREDICTED: treslin [Gekko japonicus]